MAKNPLIGNTLMTLNERKILATELRKKGYNCSQSVLLAFSDITGLNEETASKLSIAFGGGIGGQGNVCGVVSAISMIAGFKTNGLPADKKLAYPHTTNLCNQFEKKNGSIICNSLKKEFHKLCDELILNGIEILHNDLTSDETI